MTRIPDAWRARAPAMTERAWAGLARVLEHADAPRYNRTLGDRVGAEELAALDACRTALTTGAREAAAAPSAAIVEFVEALRPRLFLLDDLPVGFDVARDFEALPTTDRDALAHRLEDLVPRDLPIDDAIVYSTSATTGHAVIIPSHPTAMVQNLAHLERVIHLHGVAFAPQPGEPLAVNASMQRQTYVFATTMSGWAGAVFAKLNLAPHDWGGGAASRDRFLRDFAPRLVASEPVTLAEALRRELPLRPSVVISSAVSLRPELADALRAAWGTTVIDLYSTTETGPVAACVPGVPGHVVLLPDLFVEVLGPTGERLPDGARGELTLTGGRNRYLPLVRYRTGDYGRLATVTLADGRPARTILDLEGRAPVGFRATDGGRVTSVDVARRIRPLAPFVQHALHQRADGSVELRLRPLPGVPIPREDFEHTLRDLFGRDAQVEVVIDPALGAGGGKVVAWRRDGD
ncbi:MAG: phenylacetate--CoA ligase family protein [Myxococcales bacterium]|nr:phenylacetate--CoA ligase family protein [Myxococcales bacterium]